jgi:hypothetical protein
MNRAAPLLLGLLLSLAGPSRAADHRDGPAASKDPAADIADLYAWADGDKVYLGLTVFPAATKDAKFSTSVYYVFHTASRPTFTAAPTLPTDVICGFDAQQRVSCWAGADRADYVSGDGRNPAGLRSVNGRLRVFAGLRRDPFFFNEEGFAGFVDRVRAAAATLTVDLGNCPSLTAAQAKAWRDALQQDRTGKPGKDAYQGASALALVLEVDRALLNRGGPILSVWAATHQRGN